MTTEIIQAVVFTVFAVVGLFAASVAMSGNTPLAPLNQCELSDYC